MVDQHRTKLAKSSGYDYEHPIILLEIAHTVAYDRDFVDMLNNALLGKVLPRLENEI